MSKNTDKIEGFRRTPRIGQSAAIVAGALVCGVAVTVAAITMARSQTPPEYWFDLYAGDRDAPASTMRWMLKVGPFRELSICYAAGALGVAELNSKNPDKDFLGRCEGGKLLSLSAIADRAIKKIHKQKD